jgi:hypothetical protein
VPEEKGKSPWLYVGLGCGCLILFAVVAVVALIGFGVKTATNLKETIENPARRAEEVRDILGYDTLPEGYEPVLGLSAPMMFRLAVLANVAPDAEGEFHEPVERAFLVLRVAGWLTHDDDLREIFEGPGDPVRALEGWDEANVHILGREPVGEGSVVVGDREWRYAAQRGDMLIQRTRLEGVIAVVVVKCGDGKRDGLAAWIVPDPEPEQPTDSADFSGTPADPEALTAFLSRFDLCR